MNWPLMRRGLLVALIVGSVLTLINQWPALLGEAAFSPITAVLTYCVPFCVFLIGAKRTSPQRSADDLPALLANIDLLLARLPAARRQRLLQDLAAAIDNRLRRTAGAE